MAQLIELTGGRRSFTLGKSDNIGRDPACSICVEDARVSRKHAEITATPDGRFRLRDLASTQGTFVWGRRVDEIVLCDGDEIQVGATSLRFEHEASASRTVTGLQIVPDMDTVVHRRVPVRADAELFVAARSIDSPEILRRDYERMRAAFEIFRATAHDDGGAGDATRRVLATALRLLAADRVAIVLFDEGSGAVKERVARTRTGAELEFNLPAQVVREAREQGVAILSTDARADARFHGAHDLHVAGVRSMLCVPYESSGQTAGVLYADSTTENAFDERDLDLCAVLAHYGVAAIRSAALREEMRARAKAEERIAVLERLAGIIAHRFNNSLSVILGSVESLSQALPPEETYEVDEIRGAVESAAELTRRLLALGRAGPHRAERFSIDSLIAETVALHKHRAPRDIRVSTILVTPTWLVNADRSLLQEALTTLLQYATTQLSQGGDIQIRTEAITANVAGELHPGLPPGTYVLTTLRHDGPLKALHEIERMFEPFATGPIEQAGADSLGLAAARAVVRQGGGALWVEAPSSKSNVRAHETSFCLCLPAQREMPAARVATPVGVGGGRTLLLVDDEPLLLKVTARSLRHAGFRVLEAASGFDAIRGFEEHGHEIDCVVCDVVMPGMSGPEVALALRKGRPQLPVVFISGYAETSLEGHEFRPGDLIAKPFRTADLVARVLELL
jgi:CheY-like chemotaxis protein